MLGFYRIIGLQFEASKVDKGTEIYKAYHHGLEFSLYSSKTVEKEKSPRLQLGFTIQNLDKIISELSQTSGITCLLDPMETEIGKRAIVLDPDGHAIELVQQC